jgi:hypothetical protein
MSKSAQRTDPKLWEKVKSEITRGRKGGEPGRWSARKAQLAVQEYKKRGGGYHGRKSADNSLNQWTDEDWGTKSGRDKRETGERYLPKKVRKALSEDDYRKTSATTQADSRKGKQPNSANEKTARHRSNGKSPAKAKRPKQNRDELLKQARYLDIEGRSNMLKAQLEEAIRLAKH